MASVLHAEHGANPTCATPRPSDARCGKCARIRAASTSALSAAASKRPSSVLGVGPRNSGALTHAPRIGRPFWCMRRHVVVGASAEMAVAVEPLRIGPGLSVTACVGDGVIPVV